MYTKFGEELLKGLLSTSSSCCQPCGSRGASFRLNPRLRYSCGRCASSLKNRIMQEGDVEIVENRKPDCSNNFNIPGYLLKVVFFQNMTS